MKTLSNQQLSSLKSECQGRILSTCSKAKDFSFGHNSYVYGIFWNGIGAGLCNHEFEPLKLNGESIKASEYDIEI